MCPSGLGSLEVSDSVPTSGLEKGLDVLQGYCASWVMGSALSLLIILHSLYSMIPAYKLVN